MDYKGLVEAYKDSMMEDLKGLLSIKSVKGEPTDASPVGEGPKEALDFMLSLGERDGMITKNVDNLAGHIELGDGDKIFAVLGHVDVVPASNDWDTPPFEPTVKDGYIIARGIQDDKGPTMAAYYAMKILKDNFSEFAQKLRLIIGTDEESGWQCTKAYFDQEKMPDAGFAPDATFPLIHGEKGISTFNIIQQRVEESSDSDITLEKFHSGNSYNVVPDTASCTLKVVDPDEVADRFEKFLKANNHEGEVSSQKNTLTLKTLGQNAHGSTPTKGKHAGIVLLQFLSELSLDLNGQNFIDFAKDYIIDNYDGKLFNMYHEHDVMGHTTVNVGITSYDDETGGKFGIDFRFPEGLDFDQHIDNLKEEFSGHSFVIEDASHMPPHFVEKSDPLVQLLLNVYRSHVDDDREPFTIGGGTYARTLDKGVAYGAMFKTTEDSMHQKNERMLVDELLMTTTIYLEALHRIVVLGELEG